jgi:capsular exopolysaccharide synthesis family protein
MQQNISMKHEQDENLFRYLSFKYLSYWPLFAVLLTLCIAGAAIYLEYAIPVYEIKATIIIKDDQKGLDDSKIMESLDLFSSHNLVQNEVKVLQSQTLAQDVVRNLHLYAPIFEEKKFLDHSAYITSPVEIILSNPDDLKEADKVYFTYLSNSKKVRVDNVLYGVDQWVNTPYGNLKFSPNPNYQPDSTPHTFYFSLIPVDFVADDLVKGLDVSSSDKLSTVVDISLKDEIPQRGKSVLNELINTYNQAAIVDKNVLAANTLSFVEDRLKYIGQELDSVEGQLQSFKTQNKVVDLDAQGKLFLQSVGDNDQKMGDISMQLAILDQVQNYVTGKGGKGGIVPSTLGVNDPVLSSLLDKLYNNELEYEKLKKVVPENNPMLISLVDQINKIKPSIIENIESQRQSLTAGKNNLAATNGQYSSILNTIPQKERELLQISRQQAIKNNIYTFLLQKREEAALSYASAVSNSRVVDTAQVSKDPVSPKKLIVYIIGLAVAIVLGIVIVSLKDFFNNSIESRAEVESHTLTPILGEIVKNNSKESIVVKEDANSLIAEQFRHLRTALNYININSKNKKILVTSTIASEGKSFVAINLALSLALTNKKVVLVDLDLRCPSLAATLKIPNIEGTSQYLRGEKEVETIIKPSGVHKNLYLITSGIIGRTPSELLLNGKVYELLTYLELAFDYIILDAPPVNPVTDACILSPMCDATLYVIRQKVTPKEFIQKLDSYNRIRSLKNMAIVLNGVEGRGVYRYENDKYGYNYVERRKNILKKKQVDIS